MIIRKKKYEKLNDDLVDAKAKVDDAKKSLDDENKIMRATILIKEQRDQYKAERDTLIDDLPWYKTKVSRLEQRHSKLVKENTRLQNELYTVELDQDESDDMIKELERENKDLRLQYDTYFEQWQNEKLTSQGLREQCKEYAQDASKFLNLLSEISQHIGNKPSSSTYKYFRAKLDGVGIKEGADDETNN